MSWFTRKRIPFTPPPAIEVETIAELIAYLKGQSIGRVRALPPLVRAPRGPVRARARARWRDRLRAWLLWHPFRPIVAHSIPVREQVESIRIALAAVSHRYDLIELAALHEFDRIRRNLYTPEDAERTTRLYLDALTPR